jgi:hypothetical protein
MQSGRNATRRNRNIGTAKQGHGQDNNLTIPLRSHPTLTFYYENLKNFKSVTRALGNGSFTFLIEETRADCYHACTVDDIAHVLKFVPAADLAGLNLIVLRQPKYKEEILKPAWGRWFPFVEIGKYQGAALLLEAANTTNPLLWKKSLTPDDEKELERLQEDGHIITTTKRHYVISATLETIRQTQLYRTLLHEIGHHVDYSRDPDMFERKNRAEKEAFAHRYAKTLREDFLKRNIIPFARKLSRAQIEIAGLRLSDFEVTSSTA